MKKFSYVLAGVALSLCLVGCGDIKSMIGSAKEESQEVTETKESEAPKETEESKEEEKEPEKEPESVPEDEDNAGSTGGYAEGRIGDTMQTYFFDYTVNSAYLCEEFNGYQPSDGKCLLVAEVTVKNTFNESIEMYDTDFQIQWNSDGADDYDFPITAYAEPVSEEQLESTYELGINEEVTGLLVFEVPTERKDFSISYLEQFDTGDEGDVYFVYFSASMQ